MLEVIANLDNNVPTVATSFGLALLTILIPLMIAIMQDIWFKKSKTNSNDALLDLHVIFDQIFNFKLLLSFCTLIFVPFIFWSLPFNECLIISMRIAGFVVSLIGICGTAWMIGGIYRWIKSDMADVLNYRKKYLEKLCLKNDEKDGPYVVYDSIQNKTNLKKWEKANVFVKIWNSIWANKELSSTEEEEYFKIFIEKIYQSVDSESVVKDVVQVFDVFVKTLDTRTPNFHKFIVNYESGYLLVKILEVHLRSWYKFNTEKNANCETWITIHERTCEIISDLGNKISKESYADFLQKYYDFMETHKNVEVASNDTPRYVVASYSLFFKLLKVFVENRFVFTGQSQRKFESGCQITIDTLKEGNTFAVLGCDQFLEYAKSVIKPDKNELLIKHIELLFPNVYPLTWCLILFFKFSQDRDESKISSVINSPLFADEFFDHRDNKKDESMTDKKMKTCELAAYLFDEDFSKERSDHYIIEIKKRVQNNTTEHLINLFTCLKNAEKEIEKMYGPKF